MLEKREYLRDNFQVGWPFVTSERIAKEKKVCVFLSSKNEAPHILSIFVTSECLYFPWVGVTSQRIRVATGHLWPVGSRYVFRWMGTSPDISNRRSTTLEFQEQEEDERDVRECGLSVKEGGHRSSSTLSCWCLDVAMAVT